jgi:hypothetical protein
VDHAQSTWLSILYLAVRIDTLLSVPSNRELCSALCTSILDLNPPQRLFNLSWDAQIGVGGTRYVYCVSTETLARTLFLDWRCQMPLMMMTSLTLWTAFCKLSKCSLYFRSFSFPLHGPGGTIQLKSCLTVFMYFMLPATMLAAQSIQLGLNDVVVAGGMESMSNTPYYLPKARLHIKQFYSSPQVSLFPVF